MASWLVVSDDPDDGIDAIDLSDGTWEDLGPDGRWRPPAADRARAATILSVTVVLLALVSLLASIGTERGTDEAVVTTVPTTELSTTSTTAADPSSIDGEPPSARCEDDDRGALPLRDRSSSLVLVLNGSGRGGLARVVSTSLDGVGYRTVTPDNTERAEASSIAYLEGFCAEAERLADDLELPARSVRAFDEDSKLVVGRARLVVVLGVDFD